MNCSNEYEVTITGYDENNKELGSTRVRVFATDMDDAIFKGKLRISHPYWSYVNADHREIQCELVKE